MGFIKPKTIEPCNQQFRNLTQPRKHQILFSELLFIDSKLVVLAFLERCRTRSNGFKNQPTIGRCQGFLLNFVVSKIWLNFPQKLQIQYNFQKFLKNPSFSQVSCQERNSNGCWLPIFRKELKSPIKRKDGMMGNCCKLNFNFFKCERHYPIVKDFIEY